MSWPARTVGSILSGSGVEIVGQNLYDRDVLVASMSWTWQSTNTNMTTTLQDEHTGFIRLPVWAEATAVITLTFTAIRGGAVSGNANFRLRGREIGGSFVNGSTLNTAITDTSQPLTVAYEVTLAVPASPSWAGEIVEFGFQSQRPASGVDADWQSGMAFVTGNMRVVPI